MEYTGAPYFAAMSALLTGADLAHVFCVKESASVIKAYSPELIVHPSLLSEGTDDDIEKVIRDVQPWLDKLDCIIIGPGLGRNPFVLKQVSQLIVLIKDAYKPMIIDADGLWLVAHQPELVAGYSRALLTPNLMEFRRLWSSPALECAASVKYHPASVRDLVMHDNSSNCIEKVDPAVAYCHHATDVIHLAAKLGGVTILSKGSIDVISNGSFICYAAKESSSRRCGGQGDILSGAAAAFVAWSGRSEVATKYADVTPSPLLCAAAYGACAVTRSAARAAFADRKRAMLSGDVLGRVGEVMESMFPSGGKSHWFA